MKALVEIKLNKLISDVRIKQLNSNVYEDVIDTLLEDDGYTLLLVSKFVASQAHVKNFTASNMPNVTFVSLVIELQEEQILNFESYENVILGKVLDELGTKYLQIIDLPGEDDDNFLFFGSDFEIDN